MKWFSGVASGVLGLDHHNPLWVVFFVSNFIRVGRVEFLK